MKIMDELTEREYFKFAQYYGIIINVMIFSMDNQ